MATTNLYRVINGKHHMKHPQGLKDNDGKPLVVHFKARGSDQPDSKPNEDGGNVFTSDKDMAKILGHEKCRHVKAVEVPDAPKAEQGGQAGGGKK